MASIFQIAVDLRIVRCLGSSVQIESKLVDCWHGRVEICNLIAPIISLTITDRCMSTERIMISAGEAWDGGEFVCHFDSAGDIRD